MIALAVLRAIMLCMIAIAVLGCGGNLLVSFGQEEEGVLVLVYSAVWLFVSVRGAWSDRSRGSLFCVMVVLVILLFHADVERSPGGDKAHVDMGVCSAFMFKCGNILILR